MNQEELKIVIELLARISEEDKQMLISYLTALRDSEDNESPQSFCCRSETSKAQ